MELTHQIVLAFCLDLLIGDPRGYPHPVRIIGEAVRRLEIWSRKRFASATLAGVLTAAATVGGAYAVSWFFLRLLERLHPWAGIAGSVFLIYTTLSVRDLFEQSRPVLSHLQAGHEEMAKRSLSMIVGRDTENLGRPEILRATVETIAESAVDGIISPLFYACIGGAPLALAYKAINTLDSMVGHKNEAYLRFGAFAARLDDAANWVPARLGGVIIAFASALCGFDGKGAVRTMLRDGQKHLSPNAGIPEATVAGALGIQLGGASYYDGQRIDKPLIGDRKRELETRDITRSHKIIFAASGLSLIVFSGANKIFNWLNLF